MKVKESHRALQAALVKILKSQIYSHFLRVCPLKEHLAISEIASDYNEMYPSCVISSDYFAVARGQWRANLWDFLAEDFGPLFAHG